MIGTTLLARGTLLAAGAGLLWLAVRTYRDHGTPVGRSFSLLLGLLSGTAICIGTTAATGTPNKLVWLFTNLSIPIALVAFSTNYYGITLFTSRARTAGVLVPAVFGLVGTTLLVVGTPAKTPGPAPPIDAVAALPGAAFEIAATFDRIGYYYTAGLVAFAVGLVAVNVVRYEHLDARLAALVAFIGAWPWLGNFLVPELATAYGDLAGLAALSVGYATSAAVAGVVVGPLGLLASSPAAGNVGPGDALDSMADAVVIVDGHGTVLRSNSVANETFGADGGAVVGRPLREFLGRSPEALGSDDSVELRTAGGVREFDVTRSGVTDGRGFERGTVLVLRDVTRRRTREQRLEVLNRVLRHNLRNNANSIIGRAELIGDGDGREESAEKIVEATEDLVGLAETARDIEEVMAVTGGREATPVAETVTEVVADVGAAYPAVETTTAIPPEATAAVDPEALEVVLSNLVENAAEHNDAEEPIVVVSADGAGTDSLTIAVSDNGPGIPEGERAVLEAEREDQLRHGSGLGLWAVHWGVRRMGGTFSISENDPRGTTVSLTVPAAGSNPGTVEEGRHAA